MLFPPLVSVLQTIFACCLAIALLRLAAPSSVNLYSAHAAVIIEDSGLLLLLEKCPAGSPTVAGQNRGKIVTNFWRRLGCYLLIWWALSGGQPEAWPLGGLAALLALYRPVSLRPQPAWRFSLPGLLRFLPYFGLQSLRGGLDVARRAYSIERPLDPGMLRYPLALPPGPARIFFLNTISLLPGTLSGDLLGDELHIHLLDRRLDPHIPELEGYVAALFGLSVEARP